MNIIKWAMLAVVCLSLTACGLLDPQQQQTALQVVDQMLDQGTITPEQAEALRQTILQGGQVHWWEQAATAVLGAAMAYVGVRVQRGAPTQKVGLPASLIKQAKSAD